MPGGRGVAVPGSKEEKCDRFVELAMQEMGNINICAWGWGCVGGGEGRRGSAAGTSRTSTHHPLGRHLPPALRNLGAPQTTSMPTCASKGRPPSRHASWRWRCVTTQLAPAHATSSPVRWAAQGGPGAPANPPLGRACQRCPTALPADPPNPHACACAASLPPPPGAKYDPCLDSETELYLNRPEVQAALHANVSGTLPGPWQDCTQAIQYSRCAAVWEGCGAGERQAPTEHGGAAHASTPPPAPPTAAASCSPAALQARPALLHAARVR